MTAIELLAVVVAFFATYYTYQSAVASKESAEAAASAVVAAKEQVVAAQRQIDASKYQTVYERQLGLWQLALEHPEAAQYIMGTEKEAGTQEAGYALTLDFYAYVYEQLAPPVPGRGFVPLELDGGPNPDLSSLDDDQRMAWRTWSYTIVGGFRSVPALCKQLEQNRLAYSDEFYSAIANAWVLETDSTPNSWIKVCSM